MTEGIKIPRYEVPDYTVCFEELKRKLPWGALNKDMKKEDGAK